MNHLAGEPLMKKTLTSIELKEIRIAVLESEIQTLRKAVIAAQKDCLVLYASVARLYEEKVKRIESDKELDE
tara:strand:- start:644 stop:859 length:216 start_codon:yes stop_codon:yes gene_type:complete